MTDNEILIKSYQQILLEKTEREFHLRYEITKLETKIRHLKMREEEHLENKWRLFSDPEIEVISNWCRLVEKSYVLGDDPDPDYASAHKEIKQRLITECAEREFEQFGIR